MARRNMLLRRKTHIVLESKTQKRQHEAIERSVERVQRGHIAAGQLHWTGHKQHWSILTSLDVAHRAKIQSKEKNIDSLNLRYEGHAQIEPSIQDEELAKVRVRSLRKMAIPVSERLVKRNAENLEEELYLANALSLRRSP
jgi:hypothetical protein